MNRLTSNLPPPILLYLTVLNSAVRSLPSYFASIVSVASHRPSSLVAPLKEFRVQLNTFFAVLLVAQNIVFPIFIFLNDIAATSYSSSRMISSYYGPGAYLAWYITAASICANYIRVKCRPISPFESAPNDTLHVDGNLFAVLAYVLVALSDVTFRCLKRISCRNGCFRLTNYAGYTVTSTFMDLILISFMVCASNHRAKTNTLIGITLLLSSLCHVIFLCVLPFTLGRRDHGYRLRGDAYFDHNVLPLLQNIVLLAMVSLRVQPRTLWKRMLTVVVYVLSSSAKKLARRSFLIETGSLWDLEQLAALGTAIVVLSMSWGSELSRLLRIKIKLELERQ